MKVIVDANILFAALVKEGKTIEILLNPYFTIYAPEFLFEEFEKYKNEILRKTHRTQEAFTEIFEILKEIITIIPKEEYENKTKIAKEISPDPNDADYFALAFELNCVIWSNDKDLKNQNSIKVYSTQDMLELLE
tara:strand:+ start:1010 stop:1414 length:405 start_codon:yes stop_codon:yes gene_type:complete